MSVVPTTLGRVVTALYRRYRPENFAELIGQSQVTDPLRTALRTNRVNHAYLFSGPRGCGKTTSARILARCLNCADGPTDTPCGVCPSCVELARNGGGSLDVIEIDAASHNGVDDARDLRDRAVFAPARDRYKIFILDEAHMVTPQGFNALLKLVEEPPEHVKFIFATTEPEKVIGTIRSRTHHYPFRLVPPASMLEYVEQLCQQESVSVAPGVLPLVVRAGGGSVRDTLSLLDQLIAGSEDGAIAYERAVALLGYTDAALLDDVVDALAVADPASAFAAIDRVVQTGQDPRRFVEDLLERLRDLIVVAATNESAAAVLRGVSPEELDTMTRQAGVFGATGLSRAADIANRALTEMTGATSPRLHLELMTARMLVPESDDTQRGALARVERLERRIGVGDAGGHQAAPGAQASGAQVSSAPATGAPVPELRTSVRDAPASSTPAPATSTRSGGESTPAATAAAAPRTSTAAAPAGDRPSGGEQSDAPDANAVAPVSPADAGAVARDAAASWAAAVPSAPEAPSGPATSSGTQAPAAAGGPHRPDRADAEAPAAPPVSPSSTGQGTAVGDEPVVRPVGSVGFQQMRDAWPQVVEHVQRAKRSAWSVVVTAQVTALRDDVLTLTFPSQQDVASFKEMSDPSTSVSELLRTAILDVLGLRVKFVARGPGAPGGAPGGSRPAGPGQAQSGERRQSVDPRTSGTPQRPGVQEQTSERATAPAPARQAPAQQTPAQQTPAGQASGQHAPTGSSAQQAPAAPEGPASGQRTPPEPSTPVTDWAVATIPASDPTADVVPEHAEPAWAAPFGSVPVTDAPRAAEPSEPSGTPTAAGTPVGAGATADETRQQASASTAPAPTPAVQTPVPASQAPAGGSGPDVPVDDYPLDDDPYGDAAPFPDPGYGRPQQQVPTAAATPTAPATQPTPPAQRSAPPAPAPQVRRAAVSGRYGEAVVREILGAQFIEETSLHEEGA
uniref:DNA-directed DNA polymerase n=1 Tax=Neobacillus citreus TaxID=2833578 RepID=A0A942T8M8_9BACI